MNKSESIKNIAIAMCQAQSEMGGAHKGKSNPFFKSKYADLGAVVQAVKGPFTNNGLSYVQFPIEEGGRIGIETILMHISGEWMAHSFTVNLAKQDAQGAGSAITYCRRYGLQAIAGIPSDDDDGNNASKKAPQKVKPAFPKGLEEPYNHIREALNAGDMQVVGELFRGFSFIEEQLAVQAQFSSKDRAAISKFMQSDAFKKPENPLRKQWLTDKELEQLNR